MSTYLADIHFIDGQALDPTSFGEFDTNGIWQPKLYTGTYGTNGFKLDFADNSSNTATTLGKDTSGNGNNWTPNNLSVSSGGPTSVAAASGALPIFNTTDTYGTVKGTGTRTDGNSGSIVLALPFDGVNNGTSFVDQSATIKGSGSAKTITRTNTLTSTAQSKFYGSSALFSGTGQQITVANSSDFNLLGSDYTIELWLFATSSALGGLIVRGSYVNNTGYALYFNGSRVDLYYGQGLLATNTGTLNLNKWHHVAVVQSGSSQKIYVDGTLSATGSLSRSDNNSNLDIGHSATSWDQNYVFSGYLQDVRIYKGVAKYTSNFNPPSSTQNVTVAADNDSLVDVPTNGVQPDTGVGGEVRGNYCTLNPLSGSSTHPLANGNLEKVSTSGSGNRFGTIGITSGKYYWENAFTTIGSSVASCGLSSNGRDANDIAGLKVYEITGTKYNGSSSSSYGASWGANDVIGIAFDADNGTLAFYKNGVSQGTAFTGLTGLTWFPVLRDDGGYTGWINFGQRPFAYTAPSGFKALCTANLPAPVVTKPSSVFDVVLYSGTSATQNISSLGFSPDLVFGKSRSNTYSPTIQDSVRGAGKTIIYPNQTVAENFYNEDWINSFNSNGFTLPNGFYNQSGQSYVAWCWDAGSSTVTNTQGSITSSVRANASAGFSIVTYTGNGSNATVGHGLGVSPELIIVKKRSSSENWLVYFKGFTSNEYLYLNSTNAKASFSGTWGSLPTSSVFGVFDQSVNLSTATFVAYCFAPVAVYSAFGSYTGNGSTDGAFVYTGFRPRWLLIRRTNDAAQWLIFDTARGTSNVIGPYLYANSSLQEDGFGALTWLDIVSNGFKLRTTLQDVNANASSYIYAAFAEAPFSLARAR